MKRASILPPTEVFVNVVTCDSAKRIFRTKQFRELTRFWHFTPIYLCFVTCKEIGLHVPEPVFEHVCLWVVEGNHMEAVDVAIGQAENSVSLWFHAIAIRLLRADRIVGNSNW
jgi:hypothetical protein